MEISSEANKVKEEAEEVRKAWQELDVSKTAQELQVWLSMYDLFVDTRNLRIKSNVPII